MRAPITIVIPVYNRETTLKRTLDSISSQSVKPQQVILVDNNSTDSGMEIMQQWSSEQIGVMDVKILTELKRGATAARNRGLKEVTTDYVMFFDSDDEMLPDHIRDFNNAIVRSPDGDIFGRDVMCVHLDGSRRKLYYRAYNPMFNHLFRASLATQRIVVRTSLVREAGGWCEALPGWNDFELGVRLLLKSPKMYQLAGEPSVIVYRQENSITGTDFSSNPEKWELSLDTIEQDLSDSPYSDKIKWLEAARMILAAQYKREAKKSSDNAYSQNALSQSERLRGEVLSRVDSKWKYRLIFYHNYIFNRLTWVLCKMIL